MALVAFSSPSAPPPGSLDLHPFERLTTALSTSFCSIDREELAEAIERSMSDVAAMFSADECTLIHFGDRNAVSVAGAWAAPSIPPMADEDLAELPWLVQRLARNAVVGMTPATDLPQAADIDGAHAARRGLSARLAVPVVLGNRVAYGLILGARNRHTEWHHSIVERLRLVGEILGGGLERLRQREALDSARSNHDVAGPARDAEPLWGRGEARDAGDTDPIIGECHAFALALARVTQVAPLDATVLLRGETGTGKELFARAVHNRSRRRGRALIPVNCAALPPTLIESELFGHEKGAFTGAVSARQGRFELADGGTIFLDEIGDLTPDLQAKLLRVLQEGQFERVGSSKMRSVDVRIIAATHVDLEQAVAQGRFRADLYYRLSVFPIALPPLRERRDDIPQLVWFFIRRRQRLLGRHIRRVPADVMQQLHRHDWPGNVRELENVIERAMIRSVDGTLQLDDLLVPALSSRGAIGEGGETLDAVQRSHIEKVLRECGGRINGAGNAAVRLGVHPNTLRFRIKKLGVVMPHRDGGSTRSNAARHG